MLTQLIASLQRKLQEFVLYIGAASARLKLNKLLRIFMHIKRPFCRLAMRSVSMRDTNDLATELFTVLCEQVELIY